MVIVLLGRVSSGVRVSVVAFVFDCASSLSLWAVMGLEEAVAQACVFVAC